MSRAAISVTIVFAAALSAGSAMAASGVLAQSLWKARPVVIIADQASDEAFRRQLAILDGQRQALLDYEIEVVPVTRDTAAIRRKLGVPSKGFAIVLVGKDGGVKETWTAPVDPARIFALIDAMPMRQDEIRQKRGAD